MTPVLTPLHPALVAAPAAGGEGSHNLLLPEPPDLLWGTVAFLIIAIVLIRYALPRFTTVLDERTRRIQEGLEFAEKAKGDHADAELRASRLLEDARREAAKIREDAQAEAKEIIATAREAAQGEAGKAMDAAERQIQADKQHRRRAPGLLPGREDRRRAPEGHRAVRAGHRPLPRRARGGARR